MGTLKLKYVKAIASDEKAYESLSENEFKKFNSDILALGNISYESKYFEALAAVFDLQGFTDFCNQIDPHLVVPEFLDSFFKWIFEEITKALIHEKKDNKTFLWARLPFYAKFLGDGILFLWDTKDMWRMDIGSIVVTTKKICDSYVDNFYPMIEKQVAKPPKRLRCGIARGQIIAIGDGEDFVGACINVASRLQKLGQLTFAFSRRGLNLERHFNKTWHDDFILVKAPIRGIGVKELVYVMNEEYNNLSPDQKDMFQI